LKSLVEKFQEKCRAKEVRKYYSKFDVAAVLNRIIPVSLSCGGM
jgi:hypothetical protein